MKLDSLRYPKKSHRKAISIPLDSTDLAEFMGIVFGDGGINNNWQVVVSVNSKLDLKYSKHISDLINKLFNINAVIINRTKENTLMIVTSSTSVIEFLISKGAVRGNKILHKQCIPKWIEENEKYSRAFVRGLVDTDGCLYIHKHKIKGKMYLNIGFCFTNYSAELINSIAEIFRKNKINPHISGHNKRIYLYREKTVLKYLEIFGSSNPRIYNKLKEWRDARVV